MIRESSCRSAPRSRIARVLIRWLARLDAPLVERLEIAQVHHRLAPHGEKRGGRTVFLPESQGNRGDRPHVLGHPFAHSSIAAGHRAIQHPVHVDQLQGRAVELGFQDVPDLLVRESLAQPLVEAPHFGLLARRVQRQHGCRVRHARKTLQRVSAHPLRGRVGRGQGRMGRFECLQAAEEGVVRRVGDLGAGLGVVETVVAFDLRAEPRNLGGGLGEAQFLRVNSAGYLRTGLPGVVRGH